jgi:glucose-6-phosphate isomerase, archaeal
MATTRSGGQPETMPAAVEPGVMTISAGGEMLGRTSHYEKRLGELAGVFLDDAAYQAAIADLGTGALMYQVDENRVGSGPGALIVGTSTLLPGRVGDEFMVTRGHLHAVADRAELYHCLSGHGVMLLDTLDSETRAVELTPGKAVHVPGHWVHRSVNVGTEPFVTLFCYAADAGQDYNVISKAGGMAQLVVSDPANGWTTRPNPRHKGYKETSR